MTKKGTKTQYHNMEVPVTSEFASQFKAREEVCTICVILCMVYFWE